MTAPPYRVTFTENVASTVDDLANRDRAKHKKVLKAFTLLRDHGPHYPGLRSHMYKTARGVNGRPIWQSYIENSTPGAWRMWWHYGPEADQITIISVGKHP